MNAGREVWFDHERLDVYQESIEFVAWCEQLLEGTVRIGDVRDQLERASASVPFNIAEGNGKFSQKDRCRFFDTANGSALECAAALDVLVARRKLNVAQIRPGKERLQRIVRMLMGLVKHHSEREYGKPDVAASSGPTPAPTHTPTRNGAIRTSGASSQ